MSAANANKHPAVIEVRLDTALFLCTLDLAGLARGNEERLELNSPVKFASPRCPACPRVSPSWRTRHSPWDYLPRHRHEHGFVALLLHGAYVEAGDTGRHRVEIGDVIVHRAFESHLDRCDVRGAEVLVLPLPSRWEGPVRGRAANPDAVARAAERDPLEAASLLLDRLTPSPSDFGDWPDALASALQADPSLTLADWANAAGLHLGSLSRGFRQVFTVTPAAFRLAQRAHRAAEAITEGSTTLAAIAHDCGFADQAHMTRAIVRLTGLTPSSLRAASGNKGTLY
jgi:AraC-like DNA-binding protein